MHLAPDLERVIGCPNHGRAIPVLFGRIKISLDDIHFEERRHLKKTDSFKYIEKSQGRARQKKVMCEHWSHNAQKSIIKDGNPIPLASS
ncbi:unnamed protein product [Fusarium graminearum]|nr:unnamed protein product [Fusarium graminearum]